jgi:dihydrofolate reductase
MRIRTNLFVSADGYVAGPDGRPVQLLLPGFAGAGSYGLPEFLERCDAVVMGRTTFLPALAAPRWPWPQPVFVLTSHDLPEGTPEQVTTASSAAELVERMTAAGVAGDVHLVGGPRTVRAFREIGALAELWLHVAPLVLGAGCPLASPGGDPQALALTSTRSFPDGVVELGYRVERSGDRASGELAVPGSGPG